MRWIFAGFIYVAGAVVGSLIAVAVWKLIGAAVGVAGLGTLGAVVLRPLLPLPGAG